MPVLAAALPILLILVLMVGFRRSAALSALVGLAVAVLLALTLFQPASPPPFLLTGVGAEAVFTAVTILWIIFPALCLHELQTGTGAVGVLRDRLTGLSAEPRLMAILIAWFFALFIEGAAGFGTPAALAAPMLVAVGFPPLQAVVLALIGHSVGVSFGAVGTPVLPQLAVTDFTGVQLSAAVGVLHAALGGIVLAFLLYHAGNRAYGGPVPDRAALGRRGIAGWGALALVAMMLPYAVIALTVGPELPTIGGALVGGVLFVLVLRRVAPTGQGGPAGRPAGAGGRGAPGRGLVWATLPYLVLVGLILLTRLVPGVKEVLRAVEIAWTLPGGFAGSVQPLYHPGTMLMAGVLIGGAMQGAGPGVLAAAAGRAARRLPMVAVALVAMLALARLMVHAGMIDALAAGAAAGLGDAWPLLAPFVGILGAFVTGSATASNILFSDFQMATAQALSLPTLPLLGAQNFGAAVGNIVCPHNIIAACAVVGLAGREGDVLKRTALPALAYGSAGGILTYGLVGWGGG
ncbi:MAG: putative L-lactate permease [Pseudomonadota bacterium]|jgi:lactate permease